MVYGMNITNISRKVRTHAVIYSRLLIAIATGLVAVIISPQAINPLARSIIGWDAMVLVYLLLVIFMMSFSNHDKMLTRSAREDEGRTLITILTSFAAIASLIAIGALVSGAKDLPPAVKFWHLVLGALTVFGLWLFIHTLYTLRYAYEHYRANNLVQRPPHDGPAGLSFPGTERPNYWDFCYYSFIIGMTAQTPDVAIYSQSIRRLSLMHGMVSFCYNTLLIALAVNIGAGLL